MLRKDEAGAYARLRASTPRRWFAWAVLTSLGILLLLILFQRTPSFVWALGMAAVALGALVLAERLRRATGGELLLTDAGLTDEDGTVLVGIDLIERVERGTFAFKPSNGFVLHLKASAGPRAWAPGLWWRLGRRFGVGGVVSSGPARMMAEMISELRRRQG